MSKTESDETHFVVGDKQGTAALSAAIQWSKKTSGPLYLQNIARSRDKFKNVNGSILVAVMGRDAQGKGVNIYIPEGPPFNVLEQAPLSVLQGSRDLTARVTRGDIRVVGTEEAEAQLNDPEMREIMIASLDRARGRSETVPASTTTQIKQERKGINPGLMLIINQAQDTDAAGATTYDGGDVALRMAVLPRIMTYSVEEVKWALRELDPVKDSVPRTYKSFQNALARKSG